MRSLHGYCILDCKLIIQIFIYVVVNDDHYCTSGAKSQYFWHKTFVQSAESEKKSGDKCVSTILNTELHISVILWGSLFLKHIICSMEILQAQLHKRRLCLRIFWIFFYDCHLNQCCYQADVKSQSIIIESVFGCLYNRLAQGLLI